MEATATPARDPAWWADLMRRYEVGQSHAFGISGAVNDYVTYSFVGDLRNFLATRLARTKAIVVFFDVAGGVVFADELLGKLAKPDPAGGLAPAARTMRQLFRELLGLNRAAPANPALAALRQAGGPAGGSVEDLGANPAEILPLLDKLLRLTADPATGTPLNVAVVLDYAGLLVPAGDTATRSLAERTALAILERWGHDPAIIKTANLLFLIAEQPAAVHPSLRTASSRYHWAAIPLPDEETRLKFIQFYLGKSPDLLLEPGLTPEGFAAATAGLMKSAIEDILLAAGQSAPPVVTRAAIKARKDEILRMEYEDVIASLEPEGGFETLGGLDQAKDYLRRRVIASVRKGRRDLVPVGILLLGPPGTGKTALVRALAWESGFNCVAFQLNKILDKYVGESERKLERLLVAITAMSPCILFLDELDQTVQRGDSGTSQVYNSIFGRLLQFISEPRNKGNVIIVAATNKPKLLDPALIRAGRIEVKIPIMPPDEAERGLIFAALLRRRGLTLGDLGDLAARTEGWTGAEIEKLLAKAAWLAEDRDVPLDGAIIGAALTGTRRRSQEYAEYIQDALDATEDLELLPPAWLARELATADAVVADASRPERGTRRV